MRKFIAAIAAASAFGLAGAGGYVLHSQAAGPRACPVAHESLPSGDAISVDAAGNGWTIGSKVSGPVQEMVCTDGSWIPVTGYGAAQVHHVTLRYAAGGVQMTCTRAELGWTATVTGHGEARCDSDGRIDVWDATS